MITTRTKMHYDFDIIIDRRNSSCIKWDALERVYGSGDILPMWIADMDFMSPPEVIESMHKRLEHGVFGYTEFMDSFYDAIIEWAYKRHGWHIDRDWIVFTPGINCAVSMATSAYSMPEDKVVMQFPLYDHLHSVVRDNDRQVVVNKLRISGDRYEMDFEDLEVKLKDNAKLFVLCSPHNPGGRVWSVEELRRLGDLCDENGVIVISDEIHNDIVYNGYKHTPFAALGNKYARNSVTCISPSKTFNIAGLKTSISIIPDVQKRELFKLMVKKTGIECGNLFGAVALEAAYRHGDMWLDELLDYLEENVSMATGYINEKIPGIKVMPPEGTFLLWLDFRGFGLDQDSLLKCFLNKGRVALIDGRVFGPGGEGFFRMNIACPRSVLTDGLLRIWEAFRDL